MSLFYSVTSLLTKNLSKKLFVVLLIIMGAFGTVKAQISVTATAATLGPTAYTTLKAAFDAINAGTHQGVITISVTGNTTETATAILNTSAPPSLYTAVHIRPSGGARVITGNLSPSVIKLNGADSVTIDGSLTPGGSTRDLTISNSSASNTTGVVWLASASGADGANNNIIRNCIVTGNAPTTTLLCIVQSSGVTLGGIAETANSGNNYINNAVTASEYGIGLVGVNGNEDPGTIVSGNTIGSTVAGSKHGHAGIFVAQQKNVLVSGNTILGVDGGTQGGLSFQASGIFIGGTMVAGGLIEKNKISNIRITGFWGCNGIQLESSSTGIGLVVSNNFIWDVSAGGYTVEFNTVDDNGCGIAVNRGSGYEIKYNTIDMSTNQPAGGHTAALWIGGVSFALPAGALTTVKDNIFSNRETTSSRYSIFSNSAATVFAGGGLNYNDYYSLQSVGFLGSVQTSLANWQTASGQDASSVAINPSFFSVSDLHLFFNSPLDGIGTPIAGITTDIDGDTRNASTPDIGADEFTPPNCTNPVNNLFPASASVINICASGSAILSASGYSYGVGIQYQWEYSTDGGSNWFALAGQTNPAAGNTGTISTTHMYRLKVTCSGGAAGYSVNVTVSVNNPAVGGTTPGIRCGVGTVTLAAVGPTLKWYTAANGGSPIGTGSPFVTPVINTTTTFYVSSTSGATPCVGGKTSTGGSDGGYTGIDAGLVFDVTQQFTIDSVKMYPQAAGQVIIELRNSAGTTLGSYTQNFTGATSTGVYVPVSFTVPIGTGYRIVVASNTSNIAIWRDFTGHSFPYALCSAGTITTGWISGNIATYYFFYDWHITSGCESTRTPVLATVTTPPVFTTVTPSSTICGGSSVTLNATGGGYTTYTWNPGALPNGTIVTPATTTTYTITGDIPGGCRRDQTVTITVNSTPTTLTVNPTSVSVCPNTATQLTSTGGLIPGQSIFTETCDIFPFSQWALSNTAGTYTLTQNTTYTQSGTGSMLIGYAGQDNANGAVATVNPINLTNFTNPSLSFYHIAGLEASGTFHYDVGYVEYSTDGGTIWTAFPTSTYSGSGTLVNSVVGFDNTSYSDWDGAFSSGASLPNNTLWKLETINLNSWAGVANFKIRFHLTTDISIQYYGWLIDNIKVTGTGQAPITWSPVTNLWMNSLHTVPYTVGTDAPSVYYWVNATTACQTYTATATAGVSCTATATSTVCASTANIVSVTIAANPSGAICSGTCVTFTATPVNGGAGPGYNWKVNTISVSGGSQVGLSSFTLCNLNPGDVVTCTLSASPGGCVSGPTVVTSNAIDYTGLVNPTPTANNITGGTGTTVCTGAPNLLTANITGTITTYQWYLNGSPVGGNSSTYSATGPGTYTVSGATAAGCKDTSANFVVTQANYTITATAGPNGNITPGGAVSVPCGQNQAFTITPNAGYNIQDVLVNGVSVGPVGTYTFVNVTGDSTISATFFIAGCATPATSTTGPDASICSNQNYTIVGATIGGSATSGTWTTSGTGTFNSGNAFGVATSYTPSQIDSTNGSVILTLTTNIPVAPCIASSSSLTLTIRPAPVVNITGQIGLCTSGATTTWLVADTSATSGPVTITTFAWTHVGPIGTNNDSLLVLAGQTGNYSVTVTASNGCTASDAVTVNNFTSPIVTISGTGPICTDASVDINASGTGGSGVMDPNGYAWYLSPSTLLGPTTSVLQASSAGTYYATGTDSHGCVSANSGTVTLAMDNSPLIGNYTIGAGLPTCTNYVSFARAINDLNTRGISGICRFSVAGGYVETVPALGLKLGSVLLNASTAGPSGFTISFLKSGSGANPKLMAYTGGAGTPAIAAPDGIWSLNGVDNVSILQIDIAENPINGAVNTLMEYGIGLFKLSATDGAQYNIIQGCNITLSNANSTGGAGPMMDGATGILVVNSVVSNATAAVTPTIAAGTNSNNKFYSNTIIGCHTGIGLSGYNAASPFTLGDSNNDVGGSSTTTGNTIQNFGNAGDATAAVGVRALLQWGVNISYNSVNNNNGSGTNTTNVLRGLYPQSGTSANATITGNTIVLNSNATGSATIGIDNGIGSTAASNTVLINDNDITGGNTLANNGTATFTGIATSSTATTVTISGNYIHNISFAGPGTFIGISNTGNASPAGAFPNLNVNNNNIQNNTKTSTGIFSGISLAVAAATAPVAQAVANIATNVISGNTITGGAAACTMNCVLVSGSGTHVFDGNTVYNNSITGMTTPGLGTIYGFITNASIVNETLTDNVIRKLFVTGTSTSLHVIRGLFNNSVAATVRTYQRNQVDSLYSNSASSAAIQGIFSQVGGTVTVANNKVHSLFPGQSATAGAFAKGITLASTGTSTVKAYNNMVSLDLTQAFAPAGNNVLTGNTAVAGMEVSPTSGNAIFNVYYNTVRLAGGGSGTAFGSSGIAISGTGPSGTACTIDLRNNLVVNVMTPGGVTPGFSAGLRKVFVNPIYAATSNNNLWYTTQTATTPIYLNIAAASNTLAAFQAAVIPRDSLSIGDLPVFVSTALNDLHLAPGGNCGIDGMAQPIATYNDDIDAVNVRDLTAPDIGFDEFDGTGGSGLWKGVNTNWFDPRNWCGVVPTVTTDVIIPKRFSGNYPIILNGEAAVARNMQINQYGSVTINTGGQLANKGTWLINGTLTNSGTIELNGTTNQAFPNAASTGTVAQMTNFTVNNPGGATVDKNLTLTGILRPNLGAITINNNDTITLHSDLSGTAAVDTVKAGASFVYGGANAKFVVERYVSTGPPTTRTGWRFLAAPITGAQTINQAWQNGEVAPAYTANGYGMQIVGPGGTPLGFDINNTLSSLKTFVPATNTWISVPNTNATPISTAEGYMAFIRGDRGANDFGETSATTLRMAGPIKTGNVVVSTAPANVNQFISVGNPYPCAISFQSPATVKTALQDVYYIWDPKLSTYGAYVTFAGPAYNPVPNTGSYTVNKAIESGQAFFVVANASVTPHSITIGENSKSLSNVQVARSSAVEKQLSTRLYLVSGGNLLPYDGNRVDFDNSYSNTVDDNDARKMTNFGENIGIVRDGIAMSVERRTEVVSTDTIFYQLGQFRQQQYQLEFVPENIATAGLSAWLEDNYLHTSTPVDLSAVSTVNFTVTADAASKATDRFRLVFKQLGPVPLSFTSVTAYRQDRNIMVSWKVDNELNIATYEVEGSADGMSFRKLGTQPARGNGSGVTLQYNWLDEHPLTGNNFYRIRSIAIGGAVKYSQVVKVNIAGDPPMISAYPNPVKEDGIIRLSLTNEPKGVYQVNLLNAKGQVVLTRTINHDGGNSVYEFELKGSSIAHGNYMLQVAEGNKVKTTIKIVY